MGKLIWTAEMSVGQERLDGDHKGLISVINRLEELLEEESSGPAEEVTLNGRFNRESTRHDDFEIQSVFTSLMRYAEIHFAREEAVLATVDYPNLEEHAEGHKDFTREIEAMRSNYANVHKDARKALVNYLKDWLRNHILVEDLAYKPYINVAPETNEAADSFDPLDLRHLSMDQSPD